MDLLGIRRNHFEGKFALLYDSETQDQTYDDMQWEQDLFKGLFYIIGSIAFVMNLGIFCLLVRYKRSSKLQLSLLLSLSFSDMVISFLSIIYYDVCFYSVWEYVDVCGDRRNFSRKVLVRGILGLIYTVSQWAGLCVLYAITLDILIAVFKPIYYRQCKMRSRGVFIVCATSIFSLTPTLIKLFLFSGQNILVMLMSSFSFLPFFIMYSIITCKIWCHVNRPRSNSVRSIKKSLITTVLIVSTYCICLMPFAWISIVKSNLGPYELKTRVVLVKCFHLLYVLNTLLDPIICVFRLTEVRESITKILRVRVFERNQRHRPGQAKQETTV